MTFADWIFSRYDVVGSEHVNAQWGPLHIIVLLLVIGFIVASTILLKKKGDEKSKMIVLWILAGFLILLGVTRRVVNFLNTDDYSLNHVLSILLPRPGCAISCWLIVLAVIVRKKFFYNVTSIVGMISAVIFFAYPGVGFNHTILLFENIYSIVTHAIILSACVCFITYGLAKFEYENIWKDGIMLLCIAIYVVLEMFVLKIEFDPFYFRMGNDVEEILGIAHNLYVILYVAFMAVYINAYYLISKFCQKKKVK